MVSLTEAIGIAVGVGVIPLALGLLPKTAFAGKEELWKTFGAGLALGFLALFFPGLIEEAAGLGESLGLRVELTQFILASAFIAAFVAFNVLSSFIKHETNSHSSFSSNGLAYLVALGIGIHSLGEGVVIGYGLAGEVEVEFLLGLLQAASFSIHKFLEGFTISMFFVRTGGAIKRLALSAAIAGIPLIIGTPLGLFAYPAIISVYFFAAGAGAALFMMVGLAKMAFTDKGGLYKTLAGFALGFAITYLAALMHFTEVHAHAQHED